MNTSVISTNYVAVKNQSTVPLSDIPTLTYGEFSTEVHSLLKKTGCHCVNYYAYPDGGALKFICMIADDAAKDIKILGHEIPAGAKRQLVKRIIVDYLFIVGPVKSISHGF